MHKSPGGGQVTTFRTLGSGASPHVLFTAEVAANARTLLQLREIAIQLDATAVLTSVMPQVKLVRLTALPTGGTPLTAVPDNAAERQAAATFRGATASDGGVASAIAAALGAVVDQVYVTRLHTLVGQVVGGRMLLLQRRSDESALVLWPGEAAAVVVIASPATSNPNTNHWLVSARWGSDHG